MTLPLQLPGSPLTGASGLPLINKAFAALMDPAWQLNASVATNNLTIALKNNQGNDPAAGQTVVAGFRDTTLTGGDPVYVEASSALSFTINNTNTMGAANGVTFRLWIVLFNNGGAPMLGAINCLSFTLNSALQIFPLLEDQLQSTTGGNGGNSAGVFYTPSSLTSKAFRILGYMEWAGGLATAGAWASGPTKIQLFGPGIKKPGEVVQGPIVSYSSGASASTTSSTFSSPAGSLSQAITPTSRANVIQAEGSANGSAANTANTLQVELRRGASQRVGVAAQLDVVTGTFIGSMIPIGGFDFPDTLSSTTYASYLAASDNVHAVSYPQSSYASPSGILKVTELMA